MIDNFTSKWENPIHNQVPFVIISCCNTKSKIIVGIVSEQTKKRHPIVCIPLWKLNKGVKKKIP